jgi:hypothetical protein
VTIRDWLCERSPSPPDRLRARIDEALGNTASQPASEAQSVTIAAAEMLLRDLLSRPSAGRESALDLLTVDALVTYAFEAASSDPSLLVARADDAMSRLAALV